MLKQKQKKSQFRIGLYIRASRENSEEKPEGTITSQEQRLRQFVELKNSGRPFGDVVGVYIDEARSGKDTRRPQLQRLLRDIRAGEINLVMVSELSRLSRSIKDFAGIWEMMQAHDCSFLSLRENFDTTTAAGEMVLYTLANAAQFERKQVSERVSANFLARAKRGLWNGGSVPFGYRIDPERSGHLIVCDEEADIVRVAFETYLEEHNLLKAAKTLNARGYRLPRIRPGGGDRVRLGYFTIDNLQGLLKNPVYVGRRIYMENDEVQTAAACWPAIVDKDIFERVQTQLRSNYERRVKTKTSGRRYPFLLANLTVCGQCGDRLPGKSAHGNAGKIPYYEHGWAVKRQASLNKKIFQCQPHRILAKKAEALVWQEIEKLLTDESIAPMLLERAKQAHLASGGVAESDKLRNKIRGVEEQIEALAEHLSKIPKEVSPLPIYKQMEKLEGTKKTLQRELDKILCSEDYREEPLSLRDYQRFLRLVGEGFRHSAEADDKIKIIKALVHKVEILPRAVKIHYKVGKSTVGEKISSKHDLKAPNYKRNQDRAKVGVESANAKSAKSTKKAGIKPAENFFWTSGSKRLTKLSRHGDHSSE